MADQQAMQNFLELQNKSYDIKFDLNDTNYKSIENIGTGAYGVVCSADQLSTGDKVAIKKIPDIFEQPTIAKRTYREIKILKHFKHDNIIAIREILKPKGAVENLRDVYIVLDLMETDLHRIIHSKQELSDEHVRYFLYQILRGLKYIHSANVIHRDLKPSNLLVNENCDLKIGDFGMARAVSTLGNEYNALMTQYVATRWYRAPELMMARLAYTGAVDIWSVGCIFAEMLGRKQIFPGRDFIHQLKLIIGILGTPSKEFLKLTQSDTIKKFIKGWGDKQPVPRKQLYPKAPPQAIDLLDQMLKINPQKRIGVQIALNQPFLSKYHDPNDEPICVPAFDFDFEEKAKTSSDVKEAIITEIMEYHTVVEKPKLVFDFRPVPKNEINQSKSSKSTSSGSADNSSKPEAGPVEGDANFGLDAFLKQIRGSSSSKSDLEAFLESQSNSAAGLGSSSGQMPSFISANSPQGTEDKSDPTEEQKEEFKVPVGLPLAKMRNLRVKSGEDQAHDDIEMLSAKSGTSDIVMLSAKKAPESDEESVGSETGKKQTADEAATEKTMNTKEVLKAAILSAALRKQKGALLKQQEEGGKPKPMTALQKQREREEKKRKKIEKAQERKKKQKQKERGGVGAINLSDDDKKLLEHWAGLQNKKKLTANTETKNVNQDNIQSNSQTQNNIEILSTNVSSPQQIIVNSDVGNSNLEVQTGTIPQNFAGGTMSQDLATNDIVPQTFAGGTLPQNIYQQHLHDPLTQGNFNVYNQSMLGYGSNIAASVPNVNGSVQDVNYGGNQINMSNQLSNTAINHQINSSVVQNSSLHNSIIQQTTNGSIYQMGYQQPHTISTTDIMPQSLQPYTMSNTNIMPQTVTSTNIMPSHVHHETHTMSVSNMVPQNVHHSQQLENHMHHHQNMQQHISPVHHNSASSHNGLTDHQQLQSEGVMNAINQLPNTADTMSPLSNPLESLLDVLGSSQSPPPVESTNTNTDVDSAASKLPPSYVEAMQTKLHSMGSPEQSALPFLNSPEQPNAVPSVEDMFMPFHSYQPKSGSSISSCLYEGLLDNDASTSHTTNPIPGTSSQLLPSHTTNNISQHQQRYDDNTASGNMLSVITHKMMKSHVDDLTLTKTPKGTGGGYGVGLDMEVVMAEASRQFTPSQGSAPLSATESLIGDWLEVSGMKGLDAKDYEALERELGLGSPINFPDIVTSPT